jgi:hypothetical protein
MVKWKEKSKWAPTKFSTIIPHRDFDHNQKIPPKHTHTQTHLQIISETLKYAVVNATPEIQITANHTVKLWCLRRRRNNYQKNST